MRQAFWIVLILLIGAVFSLAGLFEDWRWFVEDVTLPQLFITPLLTRLIWEAIQGTFFLVVIFASLMTLRRSFLSLVRDRFHQPRPIEGIDWWKTGELLKGRRITLYIFLVSVVISIFFSLISGRAGWLALLQYLNATPFKVTDPVFGRDLSFYIFKLPFYRNLYQTTFAPVLLITIASTVFYALTGFIQLRDSRIWRREALEIHPAARRHLAVLVAILLVMWAGGFLLRLYGLVYSQHGHVFGAGYTDLILTAPILKILAGAALLAALAALFAVGRGSARLLVLPPVVLIVLAAIGSGILPGLVQQFIVVPNEFNKEQPYIEREIKFTRYGYGLDQIARREFPGGTSLTQADLEQNKLTLDNIRLNDVRPLLSTYSQKQGLRLYYRFNDIDVDRYQVNGQYRQVLLSPRELSVADLDTKAQTFINTRVKYTHGYGVVASLANAVTSEGLPSFLLRDIPPVSLAPELKVTEPRLYYGELTDNYIITNTKAKEFDYPQGDTNAETKYRGNGGVSLQGLNKLMFSISRGTLRFYLNSEITESSKLLLNRNIMERVEKIAPFLAYDSDPYIVVSGGRLFWIIDAYTTSSSMPYSSPSGDTGFNYIRNSVKVVVDAYNGDTDFYLADPTDPLALTLQKIFPGFLKDLQSMPEDLRHHLRYPEDLFATQIRVLRNFHMQNTSVFYNKEDAWELAREKYAGETQVIEPYYTIMKLPGEQREEFVLMMPFTPASREGNTRNNMVAWLAARMDGPNYGQLLLYTFPKGVEIDGPLQVEARIDQDPEISKTLTLWDQKGSSVIRGNLFAIPIAGSFIYVEPIYLQSDNAGIPEMKRVVVVYGDRIVMEPTLSEGLQRIFGNLVAPPPTGTGPTTPEPPTQQDPVSEIINQIQQLKQVIDDLEAKIRNLSPKTGQ